MGTVADAVRSLNLMVGNERIFLLVDNFFFF